MHRQILILIVLFAVAGACAQTSSGSSSRGTVPPAPPAGSSATTTTTAPAPNAMPTTSGQQTPLAPGTTTTVNPGNQTAPTGGAPIVPGSAVPTSNTTSTTNTGVVGTTTTVAPAGAVTPSFHIETQMPPAGVSSTVTGVPAGVSSSGGAGQNSAPTTYSVGVMNSPRNDVNPNPNAESVPNIADVSGMVYAGAAFAGEAADNRSLGEIAAQFKRNRATQNARVITNEDIARLNARNDVNVMGAADNAALPQGEEAAPAEPQAQPRPKPHKRSPFAPKLPR